MNITITSLIIALIFVFPGAVAIKHRSNYFPAEKMDATELFLSCIGYCVFVHLFIGLISFNIIIYSSVDVLYLVNANDFKNLSLSNTFLLYLVVMIYALVTSLLAVITSDLDCRLLLRLKRFEVYPVWLRFFKKDKVNNVRIRMTDDTIYIGQIKYFPNERESIYSASKDLVLTDVHIEKNDCNIVQLKPLNINQTQEFMLLLNTKDIKSIELVRESE